MPKVLIIGYSSLVKRRIISTLIRNKISYDIASRSKKQKDTNAENWYHGYDNGINNSRCRIDPGRINPGRINMSIVYMLY